MPDSTVDVNGRCSVRTEDSHRVVLVAGIVLCQYAVDDRMAEAHAMVSLVEQGWAEQGDVAKAFGRSSRTVRREGAGGGPGRSLFSPAWNSRAW